MKLIKGEFEEKLSLLFAPAIKAGFVAYVNNEFTIKRLDLTHRKEGFIELKPANPKYPSFRIDEYDKFEVWGVVIWTIKKWK